MNNDKHTGLEGSLLLQRTVPPQNDLPAPPPETSERQEPQPAASTPAEPVVASPQKVPKPLRDRCTLYLAPEVNTQLDLVARIERRQRSEVVNDLLGQHLPKYRVDRE